MSEMEADRLSLAGSMEFREGTSCRLVGGMAF